MIRFILSLFACWTCFAPVLVQPYRFAAPSWAPPTTTSLVLWLDAPLETGYSDASAVQTPTDWSGSGNAPTQSTTAARPSWESGEINGLAAFKFDGVDDRWTFSGTGLDVLKNKGAVSIYWVARGAVISSAQNAWGWSSGSSTTANRLFGGTAATTGYMRAGGRRLDADTLSNNEGSTALATGTFYVYSLVVDWSNSNIYGYINGTNQISNTSFQTDGNTSNTSSLGAAIGSGSAASALFYSGSISSYLLYQTAHDTATRQSIESSLRTRFGL